MITDCNGKLFLLLHAHLPFVRNPSYDRFLEENWLFEALTETYLPLVQTLSRLAEKGIPGTINLSVSPTLLAMLSDPLLLNRYSVHLQKLQELAKKELHRLADDYEKLQVAQFYASRMMELAELWEERLHRDILAEFLRLEKRGKLSLLTCVGTHPFLPAYQAEPESIRMQLKLTVEAFQRAFGRRPRGVWLPECGYFDGLDGYLAKEGFEFFFMETHGILLADPPPRFGVFAPVRTPAGLLALGREQSSSVEVWSRQRGYPGHPDYREFYRDIAQELDSQYLGAYFMAKDIPADAFDCFRPIKALQERIDRQALRLGQKCMGVHIRRTDNAKAIADSPTEAFIERMKQESDDTIFYLATDSEDVKRQLRGIFGDSRIITSQSKADRGSVSGMQDALVELYTLGRCGHILGSSFSTFAMTAAAVGRAHFECVSVSAARQ